MAKILFVVNEHPNEAFAISVARETAKVLKQAGNEIIWHKVPFKKSVLGKAMANPKITITTEDFVKDLRNSYERIEKLEKKYKPDKIFNFHSTPHDDIFWKEKNGKSRGDFAISNARLYDLKVFTIEVKAYYKSMPERHLKKANIANTPSEIHYDFKHYLTETTSQKLTRQKGITPKAVGNAIAKMIQKYVNPKYNPWTRKNGHIQKKATKKKTRKIRRK